jgi:hypothetical protein
MACTRQALGRHHHVLMEAQEPLLHLIGGQRSNLYTQRFMQLEGPLQEAAYIEKARGDMQDLSSQLQSIPTL